MFVEFNFNAVFFSKAKLKICIYKPISTSSQTNIFYDFSTLKFQTDNVYGL